MSESLLIPELIARKRDGGALSPDEIRALVAAYMRDEVGDEQLAALLMAGVIRGFDESEAVALTEAYVASGDVIDLSDLRGPTVDKHSTGGVGDTATLIVAPLLAAAGLQVAKLSGRGLGHTGGTLDKLESIPGFRVDLSADEMHAQVERIGVAIAAATRQLVPADKRIYALRDVTGTVASPALIAASVMSKKIAGGAQTIVLDVKAGDGAFMDDVASATRLAELCVRIGRAHGRQVGALVTDMSQPLGDGIGNAIEVGTAIEVLRGERSGRLREASLELSAAALGLSGHTPGPEARDRAEQLLDSGAAAERFRDLVEAQGGDTSVVDDPWKVLPRAEIVRGWSPGGGQVDIRGCEELGRIASALGAGRQRQEDTIDPSVGLEVLVRSGDTVSAEQPAVRIHARSDAEADGAERRLAQAIVVGRSGEPVPLVHARIGLAG